MRAHDCALCGISALLPVRLHCRDVNDLTETSRTELWLRRAVNDRTDFVDEVTETIRCGVGWSRKQALARWH